MKIRVRLAASLLDHEWPRRLVLVILLYLPPSSLRRTPVEEALYGGNIESLAVLVKVVFAGGVRLLCGWVGEQVDGWVGGWVDGGW